MRPLLAVALALLVGCSKAPPPPEVNLRDAAVKDVGAVNDEVSTAFRLRDAVKAGGYYALDAVMIMGNTPAVKGMEIQNTLKTMLMDSNFAIKLNTEKVDASKSGDLAYVRGTYDVTTTDAKSKRVMNEKGKYLLVYAKQDAVWKIIEDFNTPDGPAVPAAAKGKQAAKTAAKGKTAAKRPKGTAKPK